MIVEALKTLRPGAQWNLNGDTVAGLVWLDTEQSRPTDQEINDTAAALLLPMTKTSLKTRVAQDAEAHRLKYITAGSGKAMTYIEKHAQAVSVRDLGEAAANALTEQDRISQFPTLAASVGVEANTLWDCAQIVIARYEDWALLSYQIERTELSGKRAIDDAPDVASAEAAYRAIQWTV